MHILLYKRNHLIEASGGAEKILIMYANEFVKRGYKVTLATRDNKQGKLFYELDKNVNFKHFDFKFSPIRRFIGKLLKKIMFTHNIGYFNRELAVSNLLLDYTNKNNVDVVIVAGIQELIDYTAYGKRMFPVIMMMHGYPKAYFKPPRETYYQSYINNATAIQVLMSSYINAIPANYQGTIVTIGNPVPPAEVHQRGNKYIIYVARVIKEKQHHILIEAFSQIANKHPEWELHMYGDISNEKYVRFCRKLIDKNNMKDKIIFKGTTKNPIEKVKQSEICAFPSLQEGFPLALVEAMAQGLPSIGFSYCTAVNELIKNNENGYLVDDIEGFSEKLDLLMSDENLREKLGKNAQKISQIYSMDNIMEKWQQLITQVIKEKQDDKISSLE